MNRVTVLLASIFLVAAGAAAQDSAPREKLRSFTFTEERAPFPGMNFFFQNDQNHQARTAFYMADMTAGGELVTNAPYTANAVEETTQVLGDGNRIVNKSSDFVARDSQGRTRRETTLNRIGTMPMETSKLVFINDPTTHTQYVLQNGDATKIVKSGATWTNGPTIIDLHGRAAGHAMKEKVIVSTQAMRERHQDKESGEQIKQEDLGTQTIEGVSTTGKRETITIPAGQIGNERAIEVVSETWYSPELHTMVLRKHSDPRVGETTFKLTDIKRSEPDAALFQPPAGTKVSVEPLIEFKRELAPPKE
jgi:hypothetical protein